MTTPHAPYTGVILPTYTWAQHMHNIEKTLAVKYGLKDFLHEFTLEDSKRLVVALVDDLISERLEWTKPNGAVAEIAEEITNRRERAGIQTAVVHEISLALWTETLDVVRDQIEQLITTLVPERSWHIWCLFPYGNDTRLERGEDYRVLE